MNIPPHKIIDPDVETHKSVAALSYVWVLYLIPLLKYRHSRFAQFHARQGIVLFLCDLVVMLVRHVPLVGSLLLYLVIIISVLGVIKAYSGEWWKAPFIYNWSQKIKI